MAQILILGVLFCDMSHWDIDRVLLNASWTLWFLWALSLDAVTPMIRHQVLGISRNIATPVLLTMFIACINGTYKVTVMPFVFYNRTLWHHILSPTRSISITTFDLFYGRVLTIVLWCSRQVYRLMTRAPNELYLLHGHVDLVLKEEPRDSPRLAQIHPSEGPRKESTWATKSHSNEQAKCPGT